MAKKVFISFLGASIYKESKYYYKEDRSDISPSSVFYVQEDIIRIFCQNWTNEDRFIVFTTSKAATNNWSSRITNYNPELLTTNGLEDRSKKVNPIINIYNKWLHMI